MNAFILNLNGLSCGFVNYTNDHNDTLVISRIEFRHDHCNWKILGTVDCSQNVHHEVLSSHLVNDVTAWVNLRHKILLQSCASDRFEVQNHPTCTNIGFSISALSREDRIWKKGTTKSSCSHLTVNISLGRTSSRLKPSSNFFTTSGVITHSSCDLAPPLLGFFGAYGSRRLSSPSSAIPAERCNGRWKQCALSESCREHMLTCIQSYYLN